MPEGARRIGDFLIQAGYAFWVVGGAVRDVLAGREPSDWDFSTDAPLSVLEDLVWPEFKVVPVGVRHGTVHVLTPDGPMEVTSWMDNGCGSLDKDLERRDFTINAMAVSYPRGTALDPYGGLSDLRKKRLRGVRDPLERFREDPLRTLRAARFAATLGFHVTPKTMRALRDTASGISLVAWERIREEMFKLLVGARAVDGLELMRRSGVARVVIPELLEGFRKKQNRYHAHDIYRHTLQTVHWCPRRLRVRLAALFHDIAKPRVRKRINGVFRFFGHEKASADLARTIMERWLVPKKLMEEVIVLVRNHMLHDTDRWKDGAVRRLICRVGEPLLDDLLDLVTADRMAHGTDHCDVGGVVRLRVRVQKILQERSVFERTALAVNGRDVMDVLGLSPGPQVGEVLRKIHDLVLEDPAKNNREYLLSWIRNEMGTQGEASFPE